MTGQERIDRMCVAFGLESPFARTKGTDTMASQTGQSSIFAKLGNQTREAMAKTATKEPEIPGMNLPAGIDNGIAQVVECKFGISEPGKKNPGAMYYMSQAIVKEPEYLKTENGRIKVAGRRTMLYKEVVSPPNQQGERKVNEKNMEWAQDQLKMLVGKNANPEMFHLDKMESTAAFIRQAKPHTLFKTYKFDKQDVKNVSEEAAKGFKVKPGWYLCNLSDDGTVKSLSKIEGSYRGPYPSEASARAANKYAGNEPMVQQAWCGTVTYTPPSPNGQVVDESPPADEPSTSFEPTGHTDDDTSGASFDEFQQSDPIPEVGEEDLDAIAVEAYKNAEAQQQLENIAVEAGVDAEAVGNATCWEDVVTMIREAREAGSAAEGGTEETSAEAPWIPEKGEVCYYYPKLNGKPVLGKNKKPLCSEVVVLTSDKKSSTCTVQDNATKKPVLGTNKKPLLVKWDDLAVE